jgi:hypothetical protein
MNSPGTESGAVSFPREQYELIESAVMESARGRWFLAEYARRNRAADTSMLLDALKRLENITAANGAGTERPAVDVAGLAATIRSARSEIAATRSDLLPDRAALPDDGTLYERIASDAKLTGGEIARRSVSLRVIAGGLKASEAGAEHVDAVENNARSLETLSWSQELLSARIAKAMGLLSHLDEALTSRPSEPREIADPERQMPYFSRDEDLFEPVPVTVTPPRSEETEAAAAPAEKPRIVVIRRAKDEPLDIPLSG